MEVNILTLGPCGSYYTVCIFGDDVAPGLNLPPKLSVLLIMAAFRVPGFGMRPLLAGVFLTVMTANERVVT